MSWLTIFGNSFVEHTAARLWSMNILPHTARFLPYGRKKWTIWAKNTLKPILYLSFLLISISQLSPLLLDSFPPPSVIPLSMLNSLGLKYNPNSTHIQAPMLNLALPAQQQSSRRLYHHSLFNHCKLLSPCTCHWSHSLLAPRLSLRLYLMGSHCVSLPRHFWGIHLCQPFCSSLESYTTTLAGFLPTSLDTPLLIPLKVIIIDSST